MVDAVSGYCDGVVLSQACSPAKAGVQTGLPPSRENKEGAEGLVLATTPAEAGVQLGDVAD